MKTKLTPPMEFPTQSGGTVEMTAEPGRTQPYRWECSSGHNADQPFASLPFARRDAQSHADNCGGTA